MAQEEHWAPEQRPALVSTRNHRRLFAFDDAADFEEAASLSLCRFRAAATAHGDSSRCLRFPRWAGDGSSGDTTIGEGTGGSNFLGTLAVEVQAVYNLEIRRASSATSPGSASISSLVILDSLKPAFQTRKNGLM